MGSIVVGIDVGLAKTAIVVLQDGRFVYAGTITTKSASRRPTFAGVMKRGHDVAQRAFGFLAIKYTSRDMIVAIEGYEDIGGATYKRSKTSNALVPNRWTTPVVCALIGERLEREGFTVVWQSPSVVMSAYRQQKAFWGAKKRGLVPGDELLTNDHLRSAACHALYYRDRHPEARS